MRTTFARTAVAVLALFVMLVQGTWVLAGTTGGLAGTVSDASTGKPIAGVKISVISPSQSATATSDPSGRYSFVSLAPDTYTLTISATGYQPFSQAGVTVIADQTSTYNVTPARTIAEIGRTRSRSSSDLVKPGQTADVYSINGQLSQNSQALSGGGALFQTYAALSSVPGVYVPQGSNYGPNNASPYIRGGDYNQVGFEYDGIPVNRAFDNYVSNTQGITGQQELQVYTGGVPASSAGEGLSGYINQVIKTGTYPASGAIEGVLGTPTFYHYVRGELGGASPNRNFSYYAGSTGWNQSYRYGNNFNGNPSDQFQQLYANFDGKGGASGYPLNIGLPSYTSTRETVGNVHIGIPHRNGDGGRDDIQLLGSVGRSFFKVYDSINDLGGCTSAFNTNVNGFGSCNDVSLYPTGVKNVYTGPIFNGFNPNLVQPYYYPSSSGALTGNNPNLIDPNFRGGDDNTNGIVKVQYQKNFGATAYVRAYGYTNYSSWSIYDPVGYYYSPATAAGALDYELNTHTRGVALEFADQITSRHLLQGSASYTFASVIRANNTTSYQPGVSGFRLQLRDGSQNCYSPTTGAMTNCYSGNSLTGGITAGAYYDPTKYNGALPAIGGAAAAAGAAYQVVNSGYAVTYNTVDPKFTNLSLSDSWQVSDRFKLDFGLRYNRYLYALADTGAQALVGGNNTANFLAYNNEHCYNTSTLAIVTVAPGAACAAGYARTNLSNSYAGTVDSSVVEPRVGGTFTVSPYDVVRFSAGKYSQPSNSAYVQYNRAGDLAGYTAANFFLYGFNTPRHDSRPQLSYNYDLSYEKRLKNAPLSFSFSPFYRQTKEQSQSFYLDPKSNFVSGLNVGTLRAFGYELYSRYGDFNRDGLSAQVSFAYTNSKIRYENFAGTNRNIIDTINQTLVGGYNALTQAGGGSPCYGQTGGGLALVGGACPAGSNVNPYYNSPLQAGLDRNGYYSPYDVIPAAVAGVSAAGSSNSYEVPFVTTAIVQYRKNGWRFVPTLQYDSGFRYGSPYAWIGYDPSSGTPADPATKTPAAPCDPTNTIGTCGTVFRPNPYTGRYDSLGQWKSPGTLSLGLQVAKDLSKRLTATAILTNIYRHCFTHGYAWETGGSQACGYSYNADYVPGVNAGAFIGNGTGPNATNFLQHDPYGYAPGGVPVPFNAFVSLQYKI